MSTTSSIQKLRPLNNASNNVEFLLDALDNSVIVMLNPDVNHDGKRYYGSATVMNMTTNGFAAGSGNVRLDSMLGQLKALNPNCSSVVLTILSQNNQGPGQIAWEIKNDGNHAIGLNYQLPDWTARMDSFIINIY